MAGINPFSIAQGAWRANAVRSMGQGLQQALEQWESLKYVDAAAQDIGNIMGKPEYGSFFANIGRMVLSQGGGAGDAQGAMSAIAGRFAGAGLDMMVGSLQHQQEMERLRTSQAGQMALAKQYGDQAAAESASRKEMATMEMASRFGQRPVFNADGSISTEPLPGIPETMTREVAPQQMEVAGPPRPGEGPIRTDIPGTGRTETIPVRQIASLPGTLQPMAGELFFSGARDTAQTDLRLREIAAEDARLSRYSQSQVAFEGLKHENDMVRMAEQARLQSEYLEQKTTASEEAARLRDELQSGAFQKRTEAERRQVYASASKLFLQAGIASGEITTPDQLKIALDRYLAMVEGGGAPGAAPAPQGSTSANLRRVLGNKQ